MAEVKVTYGSVLSQLAGRSSDVIKLDKPVLSDLIQTLVKKHNREFGNALVDSGTGGLVPGIAVLVNGSISSPLNDELRDGDEVAFLFQLAGG